MNIIERIKNNSAAKRIPNHAVCFKSPIDDPLKGIAIGDGSTGCLIWPEKDKLVFSVNHTDLWDLCEGEEIRNWNMEEEEHTNALRTAGRLELRFFAPVLDLIYQKDYDATLSLEKAEVKLHSQTPFSGLEVEAFASAKHQCTVITVAADFADENGMEVYLENWGSRTFGHWYAQIQRDASRGLTKTDSSFEDNLIYISRELGDRAFCTAVLLESEKPFEKARPNAHSVIAQLGSAKKHAVKIYLTVAIAENESSAIAQAKSRLHRISADCEQAYQAHLDDWRSYWDKSMIEFNDNYIENLWYLNGYFGKCEMQGNYPPHFCNGIWGFQHDYVPWNHFFHWNMQLQYWGHLASGHDDLLKTYLDFRYRQLPAARRHAEKYRGVSGALYTDVAGANAVCDKNTCNNLTPGSQIAHCFWLHYLYSGDFDYLLEKGFPVIFSTTEFYMNCLQKGEDGHYHLYHSQAYESSPLMDDVITDHSAIRTIFADAAACMDLLDKRGMLQPEYDLRKQLKEIGGQLEPIRTVALEDDEYYTENGKKYIASGVGKGRPIVADAIPVTGVFCGDERDPDESALEDVEYWKKITKGTVIRKTFNSKHFKNYYGFPDPEYSMVFPNSCVGLEQKDSKLFCAVVNMMNMKQPFVLLDKQQVTLLNQESVPYMGWSLDPIVLARLGNEGCRAID